MIFHTTYTYLAKQLPCRFVLLGTFCLLPAGNLLAAKVPEFIKNTSRVTAEGFIELVHELPNLVFVDSRMRDDRKQGFIEDSVSLPNVDTTCGSLSLIISKKNTPAIFYCNGANCIRSAKAIKIAAGCGYNNIYWFRGGFEEWLEKGYPYLQE